MYYSGTALSVPGIDSGFNATLARMKQLIKMELKPVNDRQLTPHSNLGFVSSVMLPLASDDDLDAAMLLERPDHRTFNKINKLQRKMI